MDTPPQIQSHRTRMDFLSMKSEVFRSKLINDFHLLQIIDEKGAIADEPQFYPSDILDPKTVLDNMIKKPNGLVRFQIVHSHHDDPVTNADRRRNRVKNKFSSWTPIDLWAHWVVRGHYFQTLILCLILMNCVVLGLQAEVSNRPDASLEPLKLALDIFDYCSLFIFILEILLKWTDQFWAFWMSYWNIFDFLLTVTTLVPEIMSIASGTFGKRTLDASSAAKIQVVVRNFRTCRVLRSLKLVYRFENVRIILMTTAKAMKAMLSIIALLFIVSYIYAIIGVTFMKDGYIKCDGNPNCKLKFPNGFMSIWYALLSLFQIFTIDHWLDHYQDASQAGSKYFAAVYILSWILIGSFVFRNLFTGIMVNNFQSIRKEVVEEIESIKEDEKRQREIAAFAEELDKPVYIQIGTSSVSNVFQDLDYAQGSVDEMMSMKDEDTRSIKSNIFFRTDKASLEWQRMVEKNLKNIAAEDSSCYWPKDTLFCYFLAMEALMENLEERRQLLTIAIEALLHVHDNP